MIDIYVTRQLTEEEIDPSELRRSNPFELSKDLNMTVQDKKTHIDKLDKVETANSSHEEKRMDMVKASISELP